MNPPDQFTQKNSRIYRVLFWIILLSGLYLRFYQYLMGRSLWEDEAHMAVNVLTRSLGGMLQQLDYSQAAPALFLLTVKTFNLIGGDTPLALRALPFLASVLTLPLFYYVLLNLTRSRVAALIGFFTFSVNLDVIYYSSELKPYGLDVAAYVLMAYLMLTQHPYIRERRNAWLGIAGSLCMLYSNIAFIILFCIACNLMVNYYRERNVSRGELRVSAIWGIVFLVNYFVFIFHHPYEAVSRKNYSFTFPPLPLFGKAFNAFMDSTIHDIGFRLLLHVSESCGFAFILLFLLIVALVHAIYKKQYTLLLFTCLPILLHFTLSLFRIYPFWYRFMLYFVPPLILLMASGVMIVSRFLSSKLHFIAGSTFAILCCYFFTVESFRQFPLANREIKPALNYINEKYPGTYVYITTPYTLYKYYTLTGYTKDTLFEGLEWNIPPEKYYESVAGANRNYLLLHATDFSVDGYRRVMEDLKKKHLVVKEFSYKTYTVSEVKPLHADSTSLNLNYTWFNPEAAFDLNGKKVAAIWSSTISSQPITLAPGTYKVTIIAAGTPAKGIFPHLSIFADGNKMIDFYTQKDDAAQNFTLIQKTGGPVSFKIVMDNDATDASKKEDRNAFIHRLVIQKISE